LRHVRDNRHRLIRDSYSRDGNGCLMHLLSETLPPEQRINSREDLTRFFTGGTGPGWRELPEYQPARWLVRLIDGQRCIRYRGFTDLSWNDVIQCLEEVIAHREALEREAAMVESRAKRKSRRVADPSR
jgi:hypothetical protein